MAKRISDFLLGGFTGGMAGTGAVGGLGQAGLLAGGMSNPWAWGLLAGSAGLGGLSSLLSEDDVSEEEKLSMRLSNELASEKLEEFKDVKKARRREEKTRKQFSGTLGSMFAGARLAGGRPSLTDPMPPSGRLH